MRQAFRRKGGTVTDITTTLQPRLRDLTGGRRSALAPWWLVLLGVVIITGMQPALSMAAPQEAAAPTLIAINGVSFAPRDLTVLVGTRVEGGPPPAGGACPDRAPACRRAAGRAGGRGRRGGVKRP